MAERRMFARSIISSARFLRMPATSRLLYYDLGMAADDDGCVEAFAVMRMIGATEDDLNVLVTKGFVRLLNEELVAYITDWQTNNQIRKDRYHEGRYKDLIGCVCNVKLLPDNQAATGCQPNVNQMGDILATEVRLGKDSIGEVNNTILTDCIGHSDECSDQKSLPKKTKAKRFVPPTVAEATAYCQERGNRLNPEAFVDYYASKGWMVGKNPMRGWKAAVRTWERKDNPAPATPKDDHCGYILAPLEDPWETAMRNQQEASHV